MHPLTWIPDLSDKLLKILNCTVSTGGFIHFCVDYSLYVKIKLCTIITMERGDSAPWIKMEASA
jgi:hypothetical protein